MGPLKKKNKNIIFNLVFSWSTAKALEKKLYEIIDIFFAFLLQKLP